MMRLVSMGPFRPGRLGPNGSNVRRGFGTVNGRKGKGRGAHRQAGSLWGRGGGRPGAPGLAPEQGLTGGTKRGAAFAAPFLSHHGLGRQTSPAIVSAIFVSFMRMPVVLAWLSSRWDSPH